MDDGAVNQGVRFVDIRIAERNGGELLGTCDPCPVELFVILIQDDFTTTSVSQRTMDLFPSKFHSKECYLSYTPFSPHIHERPLYSVSNKKLRLPPFSPPLFVRIWKTVYLAVYGIWRIGYRY